MRQSVKDKLKERNRDEWEHLIYQWIHNEEDRKILTRRLLDGIVYSKLSEEFHLSENQIKDRIYEAQNQLFSHT